MLFLNSNTSFLRCKSPKTWGFLLILLVVGGPLAAQTDAPPGRRAYDTLRMPRNGRMLTIHPTKRMPEFELEEKKEGTFVTGVPRVAFDPIRGFGAGGNAFLYWNKTQDDPLFGYTPYRHRLSTEFFIFQNGRVRLSLNYDAPYIFGLPWRLRADAVIWEDPEAQYWGIGRQNIQRPLRFRDKTPGGSELPRNFARLADYETNLARLNPDGTTDLHHHHIIHREMLYNLLAERVFLGGKLRLMFGYEALFTSFSSYKGNYVEGAIDANGQEVEAPNAATLVDIQIADGTWDRFNLDGFTGDNSWRFTSMLAGALIYDTRDFEPDPTRGVFLEYSHEYSAPWAGSSFDFNKFMVQGQFITTPLRWRNGRSRLTLATLGAFGHIFGPRINFIEMWDLSSQAEAGGILVLGGERSIRGYREARFVAPTAALGNLEARTYLYDFRMLRQHINLGLVGFYDFGSVWDRPQQLSLTDWRGAPGAGARIVWNQSTILRFDMGFSREGSQAFFSFGHIF